MSFVDRALSRAVSVRPGRAALLVLTSPFYLVGLLAGVVVVSAVLVYRVTAQGFDDVRSRGGVE
jgi:hypothetical protein